MLLSLLYLTLINFYYRSLSSDYSNLTIRKAVSIALKQKRRLTVNGIIIGLTLLLQGMNQYISTSFGFTETIAGIANSVYQGVGALSGVFLAAAIVNIGEARVALRKLVYGGLVGYCFFVVFALILNSDHEESSAIDVTILMILNAIFGCCLMGALPLFLLDSIFIVNGNRGKENYVGENIVSGMVYLVAMFEAAVLTVLTTDVSGLTAVLLVGILLAVSVFSMYLLDKEEEEEGGENISEREQEQLMHP